MWKFLLYWLFVFTSLPEIYSGGCWSCFAKDRVRLNSKIKKYLEDNTSETRKNLYQRDVDTLATIDGCASFWGEYQFVYGEKLICALYLFYKKDKGILREGKVLMYCLIILERAITQNVLPQFNLELEGDIRKIRCEIESIKIPTEIALQ